MSNTKTPTKADLLADNKALIDTIGSNLYFAAKDFLDARKSQYDFDRADARVYRRAVRSQMIMLRFLRNNNSGLYSAVIDEARGYFQRDRARKARLAAELKEAA